MAQAEAIPTPLPEWMVLPDASGEIFARYSPVHDILVIKRRGVEKRYNLAEIKRKYAPSIDKSQNSC